MNPLVLLTNYLLGERNLCSSGNFNDLCAIVSALLPERRVGRVVRWSMNCAPNTRLRRCWW